MGGVRQEAHPMCLMQRVIRYIAVAIAAILFSGWWLGSPNSTSRAAEDAAAPDELQQLAALQAKRPYIPPPGTRFSCSVEGVYDGDGPIYCADGLKIRLTAIAAREVDGSCSSGHPCPDASAEAATEALLSLVGGQILTCEATGETYGRVAAWCWLPDGREVNCEMVRSGTALHWVKFDPEMRMCGAGTPESD